MTLYTDSPDGGTIGCQADSLAMFCQQTARDMNSLQFHIKHL